MKMKKLVEQRSILGILTAVILLFTLILAKNSFAMPPSAVSLLDFTVTSQQDAALAEWETATELSAVGFTIERRQVNASDDDFADISGFINAEGDVIVGAEYSYLDETAVNGQTYLYRLMEYEVGNDDPSELERVQITIGVEPTATSITTGGGDNTATPRPTTPPTATPRPSATATRNTTATAIPTVRATAVSPTTFPTVAPTTASGNTTNPTATATRISPTATRQSDSQESAQNNNGSTDIAFAQEETPLPTTAAYPAETTPNTQPTDNNDYPADNNNQPISQETATPYPIAIEALPTDGNDNGGVNVIGSGENDNNGTTDVVEDNGGNLTLWIGFIAALLIFIAGVIGAAVLFVRKK